MNDCDIQEINQKFLNHNYPTDVITFDLSEGDTVHADIIIGYETVKLNSKHYKVKFYNEICRVMVHGVLHVLEFDDKTNHDKDIMHQKENEALEVLSEMLR